MDQIPELYISLSKIVLNIRENDTLYDIFISTNNGHGYKLSCSDPNKFPNRIITAQYQVIDILNNFLVAFRISLYVQEIMEVINHLRYIMS